MTISQPNHTAKFGRWHSFESLETFVESAKAFKPADDPTDLAAYFTTRDLGQPDDPKTGNPVVAASLVGCSVVWSDDAHALVFAVADPPTVATRSEIGVLFLLTCRHTQWQIDDLLAFTTSGKYAGVAIDLTADVGPGYRLGEESANPPVVTIRESQGGRGYNFSLSASYTFLNGRLTRRDLK